MKLVDQVISISQAIKLYELGIVQNSLFYHTQDKSPVNPNLHYYGYAQADMPLRISYTQQSKLSTANVHVEYSAFNASELGRMLPAMIKECKLTQWPIHSDISGKTVSYGIQYRFRAHDPVTHGVFPQSTIFGDTEASARANLLIALLEEKILAADKCNERLTDK